MSIRGNITSFRVFRVHIIIIIIMNPRAHQQHLHLWYIHISTYLWKVDNKLCCCCKWIRAELKPHVMMIGSLNAAGDAALLLLLGFHPLLQTFNWTTSSIRRTDISSGNADSIRCWSGGGNRQWGWLSCRLLFVSYNHKDCGWRLMLQFVEGEHKTTLLKVILQIQTDTRRRRSLGHGVHRREEVLQYLQIVCLSWWFYQSNRSVAVVVVCISLKCWIRKTIRR